MNYSADRAITSADDDLLGRSSFSSRLGQAICDYKGEDSLVIGLFGQWGTGKTSVINMTLQAIEKITQNNEEKPIILKFAPWNYNDKDSLIWLFFRELQSKIETGGNEKFKKELGTILKEYAGLFEVATFVPVAGTVLAAGLKAASQATGEILTKSPDLTETKNKLANALRDANCKIVVVIDDIDRLTNEQIRDVFQLVKQVGDLPNIIYILLMDRDVVSNALTEIHKFDGNEYLEKIIQIPFEIPKLKHSKVLDIFFEKLDVITQELSQNIVWDEKYGRRVFENCIDPYIHTLRDVNRVINVFHFKYSMLFQETSLEDMIGITTIEVLEPALYRWIVSNKEAVCRGRVYHLMIKEAGADEYKLYFEEEFKRIGLDPERTLKCLAAMFPSFAERIDMHFYEDYDLFSIGSHMRIADDDRFELYFDLNLDSIKISRSTITDCLFILNEEELANTIKEINREGNAYYFIEEVKDLSNQIPEDRISVIATVIFDVAELLVGEVNNLGFMFPLNGRALDFSLDLINKIKNENDRFEIYKNNLKNCSAFSLGELSRRINKIEIAYGRLDSNGENKDNQIITREQLVELEGLFVNKAKAILQTCEISEIKDLAFVLYLWKRLNTKSANRTINKLLKDDTNKLKFLCSMAGRWYGTHGNGWGYNPTSYSEYFTGEEINQLIDEYDKKELSKFTEQEQIKLASFSLAYNNKTEHITDTEAKALVQEWVNSTKKS